MSASNKLSLEELDKTLTSLHKQLLSANVANKKKIMAKIDVALDERLKITKKSKTP